jgi:hypothetical protein
MDCVEVAIETIGKIIPLRPLTEAALRANPYAQDKLKAAGVSEGLEGTELGQLRKKTGLSYGTIKERTIDLAEVDPKGISEETPLVLYMKEKGHTFVITEISDGLVVYTRVDSEGKETEGIKETEEFKEEEGTQGIMLSQLTTPFIAYMEKEGSDIGHVVTITEMADGYVTYTGTDKAGNKTVETTTVEEFFKEKGFSGLILAPEGAEGVYYLDSETKGIVSDMYKKSGVYDGVKSKNKISKFKEGERLMEDIINGVTKPKELIQTVAAVLALYKDSDAMAKAIGFNSIEEAKSQGVEGITQKYYEKIGQLLNMEVTNRADLQASIDILSTLRDMLIMAVKDERMEQMLNDSNTKAEDLMNILIVSKAVNQNVLIKGMNSASTKVSADFVIDVTKLQKAVATKIDSRDKAGIIKDIADSLRLGRGQGRDKMPKMLMALSDIHAIAAAA